MALGQYHYQSGQEKMYGIKLSDWLLHFNGNILNLRFYPANHGLLESIQFRCDSSREVDELSFLIHLCSQITLLVLQINYITLPIEVGLHHAEMLNLLDM